MSSYFIPGVLVAVAGFLSLLINVFALVVFSRRRRLRIRAHLIPLIHLAVVDLLAMLTWSVVSAVIGVLDWSPPSAVCQAHAFFKSMWHMLHLHTLTVLAIERAVRLVKPSSHVSIFTPRVMFFLVAGLWVFDVLVASIPHYGWLEFKLKVNELQCSPDFTDSIALLDFDFCIKMAVPIFLLIVPCFLLSFWKVWASRKKASSSGEIMLETNPYCTGPAYTERVTDIQNRFKRVGVKHAKPSLGQKVFTHQGYVTDSDSDVNDVTGAELRAPRKFHSLPRREYVLLKTYVIITCVYVMLWLPHVAVTFMVNYKPYRSIADWVITTCACLTHSTQFVLPSVYLLYNGTFRRCVTKTVCCGRKRKN